MTNENKSWSWFRRIATTLSALLAVVLILVVAGVLLAPDYTRRRTPAGFAVNQLVYLPMDERTQVFISAWLPPDLAPDEKIPTIIRTERYADQMESGWLGKVMQTYTRAPDGNFDEIHHLLDAGFAFVLVQSPGSCQSSGPRSCEYPPQEIEAVGLAIDWIARQPWSNQRVGAHGGSYSGTTADMACAAMRPQLKAVYPAAPDFDAYLGVIRPGGLGSNAFIETWTSMIRAMDADDIVGMMEAYSGKPMSAFERFTLRSFLKGLKQPRGEDLEIFERALEDHKSNQDPAELLNSMTFHDSYEEVALCRYKEQVESAQVNTYTRAGWVDAGVAEGAIQKYLTFDTPQILVIGPTGHRGREFVDLFGENPEGSPYEPGWTESDMIDYFTRHLKSEEDLREQRRIIYYTYGTNTWRETATWPPDGVEEQILYFAPNRSLTADMPDTSSAEDEYVVDFSTDTGDQNRWMGQMGRTVRYGDRREEDEKLLHYTTTPMEADFEITGSPTVVMHVASTHTDGAFHVYLEDVSPNGRVTYLTEGLLRAIHRKAADPGSASYIPLGVYHTFREADALPLVQGEVAEIAITLNPISTVIRQGHSLRVAIAGYDATMKDRYPSQGVPMLSIHRSAGLASHVTLPVRVE